MQLIEETPVFILCGGMGTRIREETEISPLNRWFPIGKTAPFCGILCVTIESLDSGKFVLCLGFKAEVIKDYFLSYSTLNSDFSVNLGTNKQVIHAAHHDEDWEVTLAYTGEKIHDWG